MYISNFQCTLHTQLDYISKILTPKSLHATHSEMQNYIVIISTDPFAYELKPIKCM